MPIRMLHTCKAKLHRTKLLFRSSVENLPDAVQIENGFEAFAQQFSVS